MGTVTVRRSNMPGIPNDQAMTRLQTRCIRDLRNVAQVDASADGFKVSSDRIDQPQLQDRVRATIRAEFQAEARSGWPPPDQWFQLA